MLYPSAARTLGARGGDSLANTSGEGAEIMRGMGRGLSPARTHRSLDDTSFLKPRTTARARPSSARAAQPRPPRPRTNSHRWPAVTMKRSRTPPAHPIGGHQRAPGRRSPETSPQPQDHPDRHTTRCQVPGTRRHTQPRRHVQPKRLIRELTACQPAIDRESGHQAQASAGDAQEPSRHAQRRQDQQPQLRRFNAVVVLASNVTTSAGSTYAVRAAMKRRTTSSPPRLR